ncbi:MAG: hypothetical protein HRT44_00995 [Bdellovibrionales bacterium]|nr:hypothetical protein [Bdellovibrionales bacterium]NQZ17827.1 hypothetical protein [Bdellovibrionales bacterium]
MRILLIIFSLFICHSIFAETTGGPTGVLVQETADPMADAIKDMVECGFEQNDADNTQQQRTRVDYVSTVWGDVFSRMEPQPPATTITHYVAQTVAETGSLTLVTEAESEYASSRQVHKGRGTCQTTHEDNYAELAACVDHLEQNPPPARIMQAALAEVSPVEDSEEVRAPAQAMRETTELGQRRNALSCVCWLVRNAQRHPELARALEGSTEDDVRTVGAALNRGPGAMDGTPLNAEGRQQAFDRARSCERNVGGSRNQPVSI